MKKRPLKTVALVAALVLGAGVSAKAAVQLQFTWTGTLYESGFTGQNIISDDAIGIYAFNSAGSSPAIVNPLYSICLSPAGLLDENTHTYNVETFATANPGIFPSQWASGTVGSQTQYWGIENAAYLWSTYGMNVVNEQFAGPVPAGLSGTASDQAAALEFAVWDVLYNSKGYGQLGGAVYTAPTGQFDGAALADFNAYITALTTAGPNIPLYTGNVLEGTGAPGDGAGAGDDQEFFLLSSPVPEPSTIVAGALLLLPFGVGTLRSLRRTRTP